MSTELFKNIETGLQTAGINYNFMFCFLSTIGITMIEIGSSRHKNSVFIIMKNIMVINIIAIAWWLFGAAFSVGTDNGNGSIGSSFFVENTMMSINDFNLWFKGFNQCLTSTLIALSIFSERGDILLNVIFSIVYAGIIFPIGYHWGMNPVGWLVKMGFIDQSGSAIIHISGAAAGLAGLIILKSRKNKGFILSNDKEYYFSSKITYAFGSLLFWLSCFKNNSGSDFTSFPLFQGKIFSNGLIASATATIICFLVKLLDDKYYEPINCFNGLISGIASIKAGANSLNMWQSFIIGFAAGIICFIYSFIIKKHIKQLDDSRFAFVANFSGGSVGLILLGFLHSSEGLLYAAGGKLLAVQFLGLVIYIFFPFISIMIILFLLQILKIFERDTLLDKQGFDKGKLNLFSFNIDSDSAPVYRDLLFKKLN